MKVTERKEVIVNIELSNQEAKYLDAILKAFVHEYPYRDRTYHFALDLDDKLWGLNI